MYGQFLKNIKKEQLFTRTDRLLLGVSGGVDSVVLANLIDRLGNEFAIAHCNFNLRGKESDDDEKFVMNLAGQMGVKCYLGSFQTENYAEERGISIEMAARDLRYDWFEKVREANQLDWIVVGHHLDDVLETFMLNLSRGTGIRGLSGIKPKAGKVIRPLLFASRAEIEQYALENNIVNRLDESNNDTNFKRNKVRHQILPLMQELNPSFKQNLQQTIQYLNETKMVFFQKINEVKAAVVKEDNVWVRLSKPELLKLKPVSIYLFELLHPYQFKSEVVEEIIQSLDGTPGSRFFSATHRLVVDRDELIITPIEPKRTELFYIEKTDQYILEPVNLKFTVEPYADDFIIPNTPDVAVLDFDALHFPLVIRKWKKGEYFKPLGMDGFKKLSDFFIDEKYSIPEKEEAWIMASENKVVWIIGKRIDDRVKLTRSSSLVLKVELMNRL